MLSPRLTPLLFGLLLSCCMSFIISGAATLRTVGFVGDFGEIWLNAWLSSWIVAFPAVLVVAPTVRRVVALLTRPRG